MNGSLKKTINSKKDSFFFKLSSPNALVALKADSLCKTYNNNHVALKDVNFSVKVGEVCIFRLFSPFLINLTHLITDFD